MPIIGDFPMIAVVRYYSWENHHVTGIALFTLIKSHQFSHGNPSRTCGQRMVSRLVSRREGTDPVARATAQVPHRQVLPKTCRPGMVADGWGKS